jgi:hypothetical protein
MLKVKIYMKSGNIVEFYSEKLETTINSHGQFIGIEWKRIPAKDGLYSIDLSQVDAITAVELPDEDME